MSVEEDPDGEGSKVVVVVVGGMIIGIASSSGRKELYSNEDGEGRKSE